MAAGAVGSEHVLFQGLPSCRTTQNLLMLLGHRSPPHCPATGGPSPWHRRAMGVGLPQPPEGPCTRLPHREPQCQDQFLGRLPSPFQKDFHHLSRVLTMNRMNLST